MIAALATVTLRLLRSGDFGRYVQQHMRWPLIVAAAVLVVFAGHEVVRALRDERADTTNRRRSAAPTVGWLLVVPVAVVVAVAPIGLGASAANRIDAYSPSAIDEVFAPLDDRDGPVEMTLIDFVDRVRWDDDRTLDGVVVRLTGIVVNDPELADGFRLTRFLVSCCAADGIPLQVTVYGTADIPDDTWVTVDVRWRRVPTADEAETLPPIEADILAIDVLPEPPADPYESPF